MSTELYVLEDPAAACSELLLEAVRGGGNIVLTGGSTPRSAYAQAAAEGDDWSAATLWFGDERCVAPDDERSNYGMVNATLLDPLDAAVRPTVNRIEGELGAADAAADYELKLHSAQVESFDLLLLGLGPDGHTASLFPNAPEIEVRDRDVVGVLRAGLEPFVPRVTMTLPRLQRAHHVVFLAVGEAKAQAVAAAFGPDASPSARVPASLVPPGADQVTVLLDSAAAARL